MPRTLTLLSPDLYLYDDRGELCAVVDLSDCTDPIGAVARLLPAEDVAGLVTGSTRRGRMMIGLAERERDSQPRDRVSGREVPRVAADPVPQYVDRETVGDVTVRSSRAVRVF